MFNIKREIIEEEWIIIKEVLNLSLFQIISIIFNKNEMEKK
jgi:hypothetical protein